MKGLLKTIGNELRNIRQGKDISLKEVAEKAGVSTMYISEIERDKKVPSDEVVYKLADIYKIEEKDLFEGFKRIPEFIVEEITNDKTLFEFLYEFSSNTKLTNEQKQDFYTEIRKLYDRMF
jgi:transcriptional regulator with XRE-family HTH domain